jgi:phosphoglycerol transferase
VLAWTNRHKGWIGLLWLCLISFFAAFEIMPWEMGYPIHTQGDVLQACRLLKSSCIEGSYYEVHDLGAPFVADHYGFPETFVIHLPLIWMLSQVTSNIYLIYNLLYLTTYLAAALACYAILLRLGCLPLPALLISWIYAFLPNHIERYDHYGISLYATAPLIIWYCLRLQRGQKLTIGELVLAPLCGLCGPYPAIFGCLTLLCGGFLGCLAQRRPHPMLPAIGLCALISAAFLLVLAPALRNQSPEQAILPHRSPSDLAKWSLALDHLLLPAHARSAHPLYPISGRYYQNFPPPVEPNEAPYLGLFSIVAGTGLVLNLWRPHGDMQHLRGLCWMIFLVGTTGGLGQIFTLVVGTTIRCYNRISFHLAFVVLAALALHLSQQRWTGKKSALLVLLATLGLVEQILSSPHRHPRETQRSVASDRQFVSQLEQTVAAHAMIWQLPYVAYPESAQAFQEGEYGLGRGYAVSKQIHWSWGCLKGNRQERTQAAFARLPMDRQLAILKETGFAGLVVERRGYADGGQAIEAELQQLGLAPRQVSPDRQLVFYPLHSPAVDPLEAPRIFEERVWEAAWLGGEIHFDLKGWGPLFSRGGWSDPEPQGTWSTNRRCWLFLPRLAQQPETAHIRLSLTPFLASGGWQEIEIFQGSKRLGAWSFHDPIRHRVDFSAQLPATLEIRVRRPTRPTSMGGVDTRPLGFMLHRMQIHP